MKYVVILGDGMGGRPLEALGGRTTLEAANTPVMDSLAGKGEMGLVCNVPAGMSPGSDVANLSVMGYDPARYYTGRSPLEALSLRIAQLTAHILNKIERQRLHSHSYHLNDACLTAGRSA
jgi:2,3-bisphosphoglycerate-independent phosphoglycerate mutase